MESQDAQGITSAIIDAFKECGIEEKLQRIVFFESDGSTCSQFRFASWCCFLAAVKVWQAHQIKFFSCMNHRLELVIKDAIQNDMKEVETALRDLYYIYQKSGKRLRELRSSHEILKELS